MANTVDSTSNRMFRAPTQGGTGRAALPRGSTSGSEPPETTGQQYIPGMTRTMSDADLATIVRAGPPTLSNPPRQSEYEGRALHTEAVAEQMKRVTNSAFHDKTRGLVQQQNGAPSKSPAQVKRPTPAITPMASQSDSDLQSIAGNAPTSLSNNPSVADYVAMADGKAARTELMRRAVSPVSGIRVR